MYHRTLNLISRNITPRLLSSHWYTNAVLILLLLITSGSLLHAQSRQELEKKRSTLEHEIEANSQQLQNIKKDKSSKLEQYIGIKTQVDTRKKLVLTFQEEISLLDTQLASTQSAMDSIMIVHKKMKQQYAVLLQSAYRMKVNESSWQFILSASSFNEAYQRWQYLQQYKAAIKQHTALIKQTQIKLSEQQRKINEQRNAKLDLLSTQKQHYQEIEKELKQTDQLIKKLDKNERKLAANIAKQKEAFRQLNASIEKVIQNEISRQKAKAPPENATESVIGATTSSNGFSSSKGHLPWPVTSGKVVSSFGKHPHPKIKSVQIINNGVDIRSSKKAAVTSIYDGEVVSTQVVPGYKNTVIIKHANYYTVYSNMQTIHVKRGDVIDQGQEIGRLGNDANLHFEIWHNKSRVNPVKWIK